MSTDLIIADVTKMRGKPLRLRMGFMTILQDVHRG